MKYTKQQKELLKYVEIKVKGLFKKHPVPGHGFDHVQSVVKWTQELIKMEKSKKPFLCELSAWFHDIGRTREEKPGEPTRAHHVLSYEMLREWFREDKAFGILTKSEKLEILYAVLYHWNNEAKKYDTAWILRDADKLDVFGKVGLKRIKQIYGNDDEGLNFIFRIVYDIYHHFETDSAKMIMKKKRLLEPIDKFYKSYLKKQIKKVEL